MSNSGQHTEIIVLFDGYSAVAQICYYILKKYHPKVPQLLGYLLYERSNFDKNISNFACFNIPILDSLFQVHQKVVTKRFNFQNVFEDFFKILLWHNVWFKNKLSESNIKHVQNCIESFFCGENFSGCKVGFVLWLTLIVTWTFVIVFFWFWPKNKRNNVWFLILCSCLIASNLYLT